ncbi:response regulator transcription factor [Papillibacter cinnamivorans]|uniref:Stage 0 sporulation protein A homolog n=1 Tax=Papillibacter cinnamivorans DSM 12816 TaxID=1122930 RepID=A0A1W2AYL3_9FIRM|nr:response regulator transcription factor [Papillibacter cinnamivorans]SMC65562.1 DNA-binding response regulator, OmpR family, contains REC and winged-helix (wHTH) domain [Papillibacter cinnamivorans DSM 12816]
MSKILLVEDDLALVEGLTFSLRKNGYAVTVSRTVGEALRALAEGDFDLLLLDLSLPDGSGFTVCEAALRKSRVPILFLTASDDEVNVVRGLDMGGDDYITKPFRLNELLSRIGAALRRWGMTAGTGAELHSGGITVKLEENRVLKNGKEIELTAAEYRLLCLFLQNPNAVLTRPVILDRLWDGNGSFVDDNTLSVYVRRLRGKIEDDPEHPGCLLTVRGVGYRWNASR